MENRKLIQDFSEYHLMKAYKIIEQFDFCEHDFCDWLDKTYNQLEGMLEMGLPTKTAHDIVVVAEFLFASGLY